MILLNSTRPASARCPSERHPVTDSTIVDLRYYLIHPTSPDTGQPDRYIAG